MALCAKCGATLPSDGPGFCPACGAPVGAAAAQPVAAPPVASPTTPAAMGYAAAPPPRSGNTALKVVLIVIAVVVGLGVVGTAAVGYFGYRAMHNGAISVGDSNIGSADLGVDPYPNATPIENGMVRMKIAGHEMVTATYTTSDAPEAVVSFFKGKLGDAAIINQTGQGTTLEGVKNGPDEQLVVTVQPNPAGGTKIAIVHTVKTGS